MGIFRAWKALLTQTQLESYGCLIQDSEITWIRVVSPGFECLVIICALHVLMHPKAVRAGETAGIGALRFCFTLHKSQLVVCFERTL